jgi:hypothetical protein
MARYKTEYGPKHEAFYLKFLSERNPRESWVLSGSSLVYFIRNMSLYGLEDIVVAKASDNILKIQPRDSERFRINIPELGLGSILDGISSSWSEWPQFMNVKGDIVFVQKACNGEFFTKQRRTNAHELIGKMLKCGKKAGIEDKMFLGFGGLLGYALVGDFLWNDDDVDMCILADGISQEKLRAYLMACKDSGLCENRMHGPEMINGKYAWFSIENKSEKLESGVKACNWFWFKHANHYWHSKGIRWHRDYSAKGIPMDVFNGNLRRVNWHGNEIQIPVNVGACLDWWYGQWIEERNQTSSAVTTLKIEDETDRSTWKMNRGAA